MDDKKQNNTELDELQKSIDEAAKQAVKIPIKFDEPEDETSDSKATNQDSDNQAVKTEDAVAVEVEDDAEPESEPVLETETELEPELEAVEKQAGPAGPYKPVVPEGDSEGEQTEEIAEAEIEVDVEHEEEHQENHSKDEKDVDAAVDELLSVEPKEAQAVAAAEAAKKEAESKKSPLRKVKQFFKAWWRNKKARYATFAGVFLLLGATALVPVLRYGALNLFGVRVSSSLTIVDSQTGLPLENIPVSLAGQEARSGENGFIEFNSLKLGAQTLIVNKLGYASHEKDLTLGLGSNPLGSQTLTATGAQFRFQLVNWLSDAPVTLAEARSGEDIARTDAQGKIILTVGDLSNGAEISIESDGYRTERFLVSDLDQQDQRVEMVPAKKHVFVSNRSGEYDLYKIDVDTKNEEVLLKATGKEREIPFVLPHQGSDKVAYISSRDGEQNKGGFILDGLFIIDTVSDEVEKITRSEQLQLIGWVDSKLVYVAVVEGVSAGNSQRSKVISYDVGTKERIELASSNYFNDVKIIEGVVYYSVSNAAVPQSMAKLFSVNADGTNGQTVVDTQVWTIIRSDYNTLYFNATDREWYEQEIGQGVVKLDAQPSGTTDRKYTTAPNGERAVWADVRDGKGVLLSYNTKTDEDIIVQTESGLGDPVYWVSDTTVIYRITTSDETADYILNLDGGEPQKISDVLGNRSRYFF